MQIKLDMSINDIKKNLIDGIKQKHNLQLNPDDIIVKVVLPDNSVAQNFVKLEIEVNH